MKTFLIQPNDSDQRLDRFLKKMLPSLPNSLLYKAIRKKQIKVNRKRCTGETRLQTGDEIAIFLPDDCLQPAAPAAEKKSVHGNAESLSVCYEDAHLLVLYKPIGMLVHSDAGHADHCLVDNLHAYLQQKGDYHPEQEQSFAPAICNRLDRNTEGLVLAAKDAATLRELNRLIRENRIQKTYLCVLTATPPKQTDILHAYHWKDAKTNTVTIPTIPKQAIGKSSRNIGCCSSKTGFVWQKSPCTPDAPIKSVPIWHISVLRSPEIPNMATAVKMNRYTSNINCFVPISCNSIRRRIPALPI